MYTLQQTADWAQTFIEYSPISAGNNFEPMISIGTVIRNTILNAPFTWPWNRNEYLINSPNTPSSLTQGVQDYTFSITDFAYLEKVSLLGKNASTGALYGYELKDIYNTYILGVPSVSSTIAQAQPNAVAVKYYNPGTNVTMRFLSVPDQAYTGVITYQKLPVPFTVYDFEAVDVISGVAYYEFSSIQNFPTGFLVGQDMQVQGFDVASNNGTFTVVASTNNYFILANPNAVTDDASATGINIDWYPIPDSFMDVFNNLFLAEAFAMVEDGREQLYRQRGVAALLAKAQGLSDQDRNAFLMQYLSRGTAQQIGAQMRVQQGNQSRQV